MHIESTPRVARFGLAAGLVILLAGPLAGQQATPVTQTLTDRQSLQALPQQLLPPRSGSSGVVHAQATEPNSEGSSPARSLGRPQMLRSRTSGSLLKRFIESRRQTDEQETPEPQRYRLTVKQEDSPGIPVPNPATQPSRPSATSSRAAPPAPAFSMRRPQPSEGNSETISSRITDYRQTPTNDTPGSRGPSMRHSEDQIPRVRRVPQAPAGQTPAAPTAEPTASDAAGSPPEVPRIPVPKTSRRFLELAAEAQPESTEEPVAEAPSATHEQAVRPPSSQSTETSDKRPQSVSVPTRLANVPLANSAARRQAETAPPIDRIDMNAHLPPANGSAGLVPTQERDRTLLSGQPEQPDSSLRQERPSLENDAQPEEESRAGEPTPAQMRMKNPSVEVRLAGPSEIAVGNQGAYRIEVHNTSPAQLQGLILRLDVPAPVKLQPEAPSHGEFEVERAPDGATLLTWGVENLRPGEKASQQVALQAIDAEDFDVSLDWTLVPMSSSTRVNVIAPDLQVALAGPAVARYGEPSTYQIELRNAGEAAAENVIVELGARQFGSSKARVGNLPAGAQRTVEIELAFQDRGVLELEAVASADGELRAAAGLQVDVRRAELSAVLSAPQHVYHGTPVEYRVTLRNTGDAPATDITAGLKLPSGAEPVGELQGAEFSDDILSWSLSELEPGSEKTFQFLVKLSRAGENSVALRCLDAAGNTAGDEVLSFVEAIADLKLLVSDPVAPAPVGSEVVYELELTNRGSKAAKDVKVIAQFSEGIEPTRGGGQTCRVVPGQLFFDPLPSIAAGETVRLQVYAQAVSDGMHRFRTEVRADAAEIRLVQEESTRYRVTTSKLAQPRGSVQQR